VLSATGNTDRSLFTSYETCVGSDSEDAESSEEGESGAILLCECGGLNSVVSGEQKGYNSADSDQLANALSNEESDDDAEEEEDPQQTMENLQVRHSQYTCHASWIQRTAKPCTMHDARFITRLCALLRVCWRLVMKWGRENCPPAS
jgi:hypothetical protein